MPVKPILGNIELQQVQKIEIEEDQVFTQHSIPALEGDFFQGLGRRSSWVKLSGVLTGAEVQAGLQALRDQFRAAQPVDFVADIATATKVSQVIIEEMGVRELAGKPARFEYAFTLREYIPAPVPPREIPPPPPPPPPPLQSQLIVRVIVEGEPDFDFSRVEVTVKGTREEGGNPLDQTLTNRVNNVWTEEDFPPGNYTARAEVHTEPGEPPIAPGSAIAVVRQQQTTDVTIILRRGRAVNVARKFVVHFRFDRAFVEPCMRHVLKQVADYARQHPDEKLLIVGNTDKSGADVYNLSLGDRRARSVYAYLTFGRDATARAEALAEWNLLRQPANGQSPTVKDSWDRRQAQYMLQALGFYPANVDGQNGPMTIAGVRDFQTSKGLPATGILDDPTWAALIEAYLDQEPQSVAQSQFFENCPGEPLKWVSCGEQRPLRSTPSARCCPPGQTCSPASTCTDPLSRCAPEATCAPEMAWRPNRRVELLFVVADRLPEPELEPVTFNLPGTPPVGSGWCVGGRNPDPMAPRCTFLVEGCTNPPPNKWCVEPAEPGSITVTGSIVDENGNPLPNQKYVLIAPDGEFLSDQTDNCGRFKLGEQVCGNGRGNPKSNKTRTDGTFDYTGRTTPIGVYILEVELPPVGHPPGPYVAHAATKPPATGRGSVVCKRLDASDSRFDVIIRAGVPIQVNPQITLESAVVVVKKSYTNPARKRVRLSTDTAFLGTGTLTRSSNAIRLFTAATGGTEITFDGTDNVFDGAQLTAGVDLFAEGASPSAAVDDIQLTLTLTSSEVLCGPPTTVTLTSVELTLDICARRTAPGVDPVPLSTADKIDPGRFLEVRSPNNNHERALVIVRQANPAAFVGDLTLNPIDAKVQLFAATDEVPAAGQTALATPQTIANSSIPADGVKFWAEGAAVSTALRDTGFQLGLQGIEPDGDRVAITVSSFTLRVEGATQIPGTNTFVATFDAAAVVTIIADVTPTPSPIPPDFVTWSANTTPTADPLRRTVSRGTIAVTNITATANGITRSVTITIIAVALTSNVAPFNTIVNRVQIEGILNQELIPSGGTFALADLFATQANSLFRARADIPGIAGNTIQATLTANATPTTVNETQTITLTRTTGDRFVSRPLLAVPAAIPRAQIASVDLDVIRAQAGGTLRLDLIGNLAGLAPTQARITGRVVHVFATAIRGAFGTITDDQIRILIRSHIQNSDQIWAQAGIEIRERGITPSIADPGGLLNLDGFSINPFTQTLTDSERRLLNLNRSAVASDINIYYVRTIDNGLAGEGISSDDFPSQVTDPNQSGIVLANYPSAAAPTILQLTVMAHELGHLLIHNGDEHSNSGATLPQTNVMNPAPNAASRNLTSTQVTAAIRNNNPFVILL